MERKSDEDWVSACRVFVVGSTRGRGRGRPRKTWGECVGQDLRRLGLRKESAQDRMEWRRLIGGSRPTRAEHGKRDVKR